MISIDIDLSLLDPLAQESPDVEFIEGDLFHVEKCFPADFLKVKEVFLRLPTLKHITCVRAHNGIYKLQFNRSDLSKVRSLIIRREIN